MFTSLFYSGATADEARWFNELQRISVSPEGAARLQRVLSRIDVRSMLPMIQVPTIVFHSRGVAAIPFEAGRGMAARIPGARFSALESNNHEPLESEPAWPRFVEQMRAFLAESD